jgi:hypothetical protein
MAGSVIKIKRSTTKGAPSVGTLAPGELAYSGADAGTVTGGDRLYIGIGGTGSAATSVVPIGGKYYTDKLDVTAGTLTANKAVVVDSNKKINEFFVDDLSLNGNVLSAATAATNLNLDATGLIQFYTSSSSYTFPKERGAKNTILKMGDNGAIGWGKAAVNLNVVSDISSGSISLLEDDNESLSVNGFSGISTNFNDTSNTLEIYGVHASANQIGVASFEANDFDIDTTAHVSIKKERIQDMVGEMFTASSAYNLAHNITVTYSDDDNQIKFSVNTATTSSAGVARFDSNFFSFGTLTNVDKVSLTGNIVQTVTVPTGTIAVANNTLAFAVGDGITVSGQGGNTITVSGVRATDAAYGVAKFSESYFDMSTAGTVKIRYATDTSAGTPYFGLSKYSSDFFTVNTGVVSSNPFTIGDVDINLGDNNNGIVDKSIKDLTGLTSIEVGNLKLSGNTLEQKLTDLDTVLKPLGTVDGRPASIKIDNGTPDSYWVLPATRGTGDATNEVLTIDKDTGLATWKAPNQNVTVYGDNSSGEKVLTVGHDAIKFTGSQGIATVTSEDNNGNRVVVTITGQKATTNALGVASFSSDSFAVTDGVVTVKTSGITNTQLVNKTVGIGSTNVTLGSSATNFEGIDSIAFPKLLIGGSTKDGATPTEQEQGTISAVGTNKNLYLTGSGTGNVWISGAYKLPNSDGSDGQVLITNGSGVVTWDDPVVTLNLAADGSTSGSLNLKTGEPLTFTGTNGIETSFNDTSNTVTINGKLASTAAVGVAKFSSDNFGVDSYGSVTVKDGGIANVKLANSTIQIGTYASGTNEPIALGGTITTLKGLTGVTTGNLTVGASGAANTIEATNANGGITLKTKGTGDITLFDGTAYFYTLPKSRGTAANQVLTTNFDGTTTWATPVTSITITDEHSHTDSISLAPADNENLLFKDGIGTKVTVGTNAVTIDGVIANAGVSGADENVVGVASFSLSQFAVDVAGKVTLNDEGVQDIVGGMLTGTGFVNTNIAVTYVENDGAGNGKGKLSFVVPQASSSTKGVASFASGDFSVNSGTGAVTLAATVVKGIGGNSGTATATSNAVNIKGADGSAISTTGNGTDLTISIATATASTMGVAFFPTGSSGDFVIGATGAPETEGKISLRKATYTTSGVAKFASSQFSIDGLAADGTPDAVDGNGAVTVRPIKIGGQTITNGNTEAVTTFTGLVSVGIGNLTIATSTITAAGDAANIDIGLAPKGTGSVAVGGKRVTNVANPSNASDAATKEYVDGKASGLTVKDPVRVASAPDAPNAPNANGVNQYGSVTLSYTVSSTSTSSFPVIDGIQIALNDRVLLKNQGAVSWLDAVRKTVANTDSAENGIYVWKDTAGTAGWERSEDANQDSEFVGATFLFVQDGELWADTGWVLQTIWVPATMNLDTDPLKFVQFSAAGVLKVDPNGGLYKEGGYFGIGLDSGYKGLEINTSNHLALKSTVAGDGLAITTDGVISVDVSTSTLSIANDGKLQISANYVGQTSITTVGTISSGTWNGTAIGPTYGGTGLTSVNKGDLLLASDSNTWAAYAMNGASNVGKVLQVVNNGTTGSPDYNVEYADIDGGEY